MKHNIQFLALLSCILEDPGSGLAQGLAVVVEVVCFSSFLPGKSQDGT